MSGKNTFERSGAMFALSLLLVLAAPTALGVINEEPQALLKLSMPKAGRQNSFIQDSQYRLTFRLRSAGAPAYVEIKERLGFSEDLELLVLDDPDDCLDLSHADPNRELPLTAGCPGGADETFMVFRQDPFEAPGMADGPIAGGTGGCFPPFAGPLIDTPAADLISQGGTLPFTESNRSYVVNSFGGLQAVGALTEFATVNTDCYGYAADDDLRGLVVMADIGGAQVFDTDLTYDTTRIRNMAGLLSRVGYELVDRKGRTAVYADMAVTEGMLEPVVLVDLGPNTIGLGGSAGFNDPAFSYRVANGPVQTVNLVGNFDDAALLAELRSATTTPFEVGVRAVVVEGNAPNFIDDLDGNGKFNKNDLVLAGFVPLSSQGSIRLNVIPRELLREEEDSFECPSNLIYTDLDGDGVSSNCTDGDGTSRSIMRIPC